MNVIAMPFLTSEEMMEAYTLWLQKKMFVDNKGNYRLWLGGGIKSRSNYEHNKLIKKYFQNVSDFHKAAHRYA